MADQFLTSKTALGADLVGSDLIHVVDISDTSQNPAGSSYRATLDQMATYITNLHNKAVYVDAVYGDNATAEKYKTNKPYKTITAAQTDAVSGDVIYVRAGDYTDQALGKNGVYYYYEFGAIQTVSSNVCFAGLSTGKTFKVGGFGTFINGLGGGLINLQTSNHNVSIECFDYISEYGGISIYGNNNVFNLFCKGKTSSLDWFLFDTNTVITGNIVNATFINEVECCGLIKDNSDTVFNISGNIKKISSAENFINQSGASAITINGNLNNNGNTGPIYHLAGILKINGNVISKGINISSDGEINGNVDLDGSDLDVPSGNCVINGKINGNQIVNYGNLYLNNDCTVGFVSVNSGFCHIKGRVVGDGVGGVNDSLLLHAGGKTFVYSLIHNTDLVGVGYPIKVNSAGLVLKQGAILYSDNLANSVFASSAQNIKTYSGAVANVAKHANVTQLVDSLLISTDIDNEA